MTTGNWADAIKRKENVLDGFVDWMGLRGGCANSGAAARVRRQGQFDN